MPGGHVLTAVAPPVAATTPLTPPFDVQDTPPSPDWTMEPTAPSEADATSLVKSGDTVIPSQYPVPAPVRALQVEPLFVDAKILLLNAVAASLVKSGVDAIPSHM